MLDNKGFTMIEVMLAVLLAGVITSALGFFLVANVQSFQSTKTLTDVQYNGQSTMNLLVDMLKHSKGITDIRKTDGTTYAHNYNPLTPTIPPEDSRLQSPGTFVFESRGKHYKCMIDYTAQTITAYESGDAIFDGSDEIIEIAKNIRLFSIKPEPEGTSFTSAKGLSIQIELGTDKLHYTYTDEVRFRNK